jgi:hypothetical protein
LPEWRKTAKTISQDSWSPRLASKEDLLNIRRRAKVQSSADSYLKGNERQLSSQKCQVMHKSNEKD